MRSSADIRVIRECSLEPDIIYFLFATLNITEYL